MGYAISWIAVRGKSPDTVLEELGFAHTGQFGDYGDDALVGKLLETGWYLLVADRCDCPLFESSELARLSLACELIACSIEEHVMYSESECWRDGENRWRVEHDAERGTRDLQASGDLPAHFADVARKYAEEQEAEGGDAAEVDCYFEIPLQTAGQLVGFKHDEAAPGHGEGQFEILKPSPAHRSASPADVKPWWRLW
jgi:hypothetical protein